MTDYERLVQHHTSHAVLVTVSTATERMAEEMARELLKDPATRMELQALVRVAFADAFQRMRRRTPARPRRRKKATKK